MAALKITTEVLVPGSFDSCRWHSSICHAYPFARAKRRDPQFPNWHRILTPKYEIWMSEPVRVGRENSCIRFQRGLNCHPEGIAVYDEILLVALRLLHGSYLR